MDNSNYPAGVDDNTINRHFGEEHECHASPRFFGKARCIVCDRDMTDEYESEED